MPWYKLPHADMVMWFDQEMDLEPADEPIGVVDVTTVDDADEPRFIPAPEEEAAPFATGGVFKRLMHKIGHPEGVIDEVAIPNAPEPEEETEAL